MIEDREMPCEYPFFFVSPIPEDVWEGRDAKKYRFMTINPYANQGEDPERSVAENPSSE